MKEYIRVYNKNGEIREDHDTSWCILILLIFWIIPFVIILEIIGKCFREVKFIKTEDYYKAKIKELK